VVGKEFENERRDLEMFEGLDLEKFKQEYLGVFELEEWEYKNRCGDCKFFSQRGCTISYIEAKYGNSKTPACGKFEIRTTK